MKSRLKRCPIKFIVDSTNCIKANQQSTQLSLRSTSVGRSAADELFMFVECNVTGVNTNSQTIRTCDLV